MTMRELWYEFRRIKYTQAAAELKCFTRFCQGCLDQFGEPISAREATEMNSYDLRYCGACQYINSVSAAKESHYLCALEEEFRQ